jgi:hypothetical protein
MRAKVAQPSPEPRRGCGAAVGLIAVVLLLLLPLFYVLSTGPVLWVVKSRGAEQQARWLHTAYAPVIWLRERSPAFDKAMSAYIGWWLDA